MQDAGTVPRARPWHDSASMPAAERFHRRAHFWVTPIAGPAHTVPRRTTPQDAWPRYHLGRAQRLAEEMTVKQLRIQRPRARRERDWREALPSDPRDPDVVRAKALARAGNPARRWPASGSR
jgi:hypothetical protein